MQSIHSIIIFLDIRGFTKWSENTKAVRYMQDFICQFYDFIDKQFEDSYRKRLGDGVMIVKELSGSPNLESAIEELNSILEKIYSVNRWFDDFCSSFGKDHAFRIDLSLGWGIVRGDVSKITEPNHDYLGADVNRAARLCGIARPYGIAIDKNSFAELPEVISSNFYEQSYKLKGIYEEVEVYVTQSIRDQFSPREEKRETPEVHVAGSCFKLENGHYYILISKRNPDRQIYPNRYEGCGGQLARSESFFDGIKRHYLKELEIEIEVLEDYHKFYGITIPDEPFIPGIRFLCKYQTGEPRSQKHTEIKWVLKAEFESMQEELFPPGFKKQTLELLDRYQSADVNSSKIESTGSV